ncbi:MULTISPECIES: ribosome biogenesis GTPase Der [Paracoccus]|jgi:GTP-binding protein|uniref:GTPase Der n=2 Tax=Paracoccus TaxID=265 RepID=A0A5C4R3F0_9RHOB|nr:MULTISPECIES: ribosome biogenesis GTPase Der [Paracoccus]TYP68260.1 GTP-binding protein [Stutzerimonas stutzeri]AZY94981.1 ribosome biogenesis GTPase Der [Paracoccus sp. Arc7-R13]KIX16761.1 GTP-binding protein Der [Paracoccus sp. 228]MBF5079869.1 ribosome biogenesis GTPase Der [Paracoccus sp. NBH48]MCO6362044.1 ribosome biogenesis GTPase Der [Paracoccus sp. 08]|tara:strand:+ start:6663 stop:8147 length:1485 start_codon:yes stop_codon:yes gene_type:complete
MTFTLAIVGRPNVGKSTLFNRLVGKKLALVDDQPGVTRDIREGAGRLGDLRFVVIDSAGLEMAEDDSLQGRMRRLTERAVDEADICLFVVDARIGITAADEYFAEILRRRAKHVIVAANKSEGRAGEAGAMEAYALGLGEPLRISAEHGEGMDDLYGVLMPLADRIEAERPAPIEAVTDLDLSEEDAESGEGSEDWRPSEARPLQIAVIGRPNAGKSTLINKILGQDRLLTGPEAGITRDSISVTTNFMGTPMRIFDTAGMRKRARVTEKLEKLSVADGLRAVRFAEVVVVLLDVEIPFETQDLRIADFAETEGRAVVIAVNKWDTEDDKSHKLNEMRASFEKLLPQLRGAPLITVSAKTGKGLDRLHNAVIKAHEVWNRRVPTARLNQWLGAMTESHPPPAPGGRRIRLRYMTQVKTRPPAFIVKSTHTDQIPTSYQRYLINGLRTDFDMPGTPIRLFFRDQGGENPYKAKATKIVQSGALSKHKHRQKPKGS